MIWQELARLHRIIRSYRLRWLRGYVWGKLWSDPVYRACAHRLGTSALPLLDVGCGIGLLALYLREHGFQGEVLGVDADLHKVVHGMEAVVAGAYQEITLRVGNCTELPGFSGHVAILDVLQYLTAAEQRQVLDDLAARIAPGAWCIIRTTPKDHSWRFRLTTLAERFAHRTTWMSQPAIDFPTLKAIQEHFPLHDFEQEIRPLWGWTPFNSWLLSFRRRS